METRLGSIEGVWSLLNRTKDDGRRRYCAVLSGRGGREEVEFGNGSVYCCCANTILQFGINNIIRC